MNDNYVSISIRTAGHCFAYANHVTKGDKKRKIRFEATWAIIKHPSKGNILFDTGYTQRFHTATNYFPNSIYAMLTKVVIDKNQEAKMQINPDEVSHIILSHLHADHVGGLIDFPNASCWASEKCLDQFQKTPKWRGFAKGLLHELFPEKWIKSCKTFESCNSKTHEILGNGYDLFGDNSIVMYPLAGHAAGQCGALVQTKNGPVFLVADAFWDMRAITHKMGPDPIVRLFFDDWKAYNSTLDKLRKFHSVYPTIPLIATHCPKTVEMIQSPKTL
jgi:glyoxylase-like metal-dependent hydrolase (beta-lactamase superfamily II)